MYTTLNAIRAKHPCTVGWKKLLDHLGKTTADDEKLSIKTIIESNGVVDAIWCLRATAGYDKEIKLFAIWCARQVQHLMKDARSIAALDTTEQYINGTVTIEELQLAKRDAAEAAEAAEAREEIREAQKQELIRVCNVLEQQHNQLQENAS